MYNTPTRYTYSRYYLKTGAVLLPVLYENGSS